MPGIPEPVILEKNGKTIRVRSIRKAWLEYLRGPNDSSEIIGEHNRKKVRSAIENHTKINGYYIYYAE
ncbi:MAG: hypothetical protein LBI04_00100 [Treponema sp.]|jgi:hypothetical protein|nr:hypothetical protein [Treponema sp.]